MKLSGSAWLQNDREMGFKFLLKIFGLFTVLSLVLFWPIFLGKVDLNGNFLVSYFPLFGKNLPYKNVLGVDQLRLYYPNYSLFIEQLKNFEIPHWNSYIFSGNLNIASLQSAVFYPLNVFGLFLPFVEFWHLLRIAPTVLASLFAFIYLRKLRVSNLPSFFGAMTFGFSPFILTWGDEQVNTPHTVIWLPLILFCVEKLKNADLERRGFYYFLISFSIAFSIFAGFIQTTLYMVLFVIIYILFLLKNKELSFVAVLKFFATILLGFSLAAVQLVPATELYFNSARASVNLRDTLFEFLLPPETILTYLAPDFFGNPATWNFFRGGLATYYEGIMFIGVAALIFAAFAVFEIRKDKLVWFYIAYGLVALILTLDLPLSRINMFLPIPIFSSSIPNRLLFIPAFCISILAAKGMDLWIYSKGRKILRYIYFFAFLYLLIATYAIFAKFFDFLPYFSGGAITRFSAPMLSLRNLVIPITVFAIGAAAIYLATGNRFGQSRKFAAIFLIFISYTHIFLFAQKYFSFTDRENVFPNLEVLDFIKNNQGYYRAWGLGEAYLENNFASKYKIFSADGYSSLSILSYAEFTSLMQGKKLQDSKNRADAGVGMANREELSVNQPRIKLLSLLGVKYISAKEVDFEFLEKQGFRKVYVAKVNDDKQVFGVFENLNVVPRVFLASDYEGPRPLLDATNMTDKEIARERREHIFERLLDEAFDFRNVLILEKSSPILPQLGEGSAEILKYSPNEVLVKTKSGDPKLLFLSDNYYPGWKAKVDGEETEILRANYTFRAVPLIAGEHEVRFYFDPVSFKLGVIVSVLSLVGLALLVKPKLRLQ